MSAALLSRPTADLDEYREKGYTIVRGVFRPDEIADLKLAFDRAYAEGMAHHATWRHQNRVFWIQDHPTIGRYVSGCQWQSWVDPVLDRVRYDPRMLALLQPMIGEDIKQIINQMHWKTPGSGQVWHLHQDVRSRNPAHCFRELGESYVQTGLAIDRHWADNGAMQIIPGSHRFGDLRYGFGSAEDAAAVRKGIDRKSAVDIAMEEGDLALWGPYAIHGGGINTTADNSRRMYINGYVKAANCDRGQPVFEAGRSVPLTIPALIQYDQLYSCSEPHYANDRATLVQRD